MGSYKVDSDIIMFPSSFYAINPDGTLKWSYLAGDGIHSSPAIGSDGTIYVGSDDYFIYALNPDGTLKWSYETGAEVKSSPAIGSDGTIYVGGDDIDISTIGYLYAINPDRTLKWMYETRGPVESSPSVANDGTIYVGSDDAGLYAIKGSSLLATTPWPKFRHDLLNTAYYKEVQKEDMANSIC